MHVSKVNRWILIIAMIPVACVLLYLALPLAMPEPRTPPPYSSLRFVGFTTNVANAPWARFVISNLSPFAVRTGSGFAYNIMTNNAWPVEHSWITNSAPPQLLKPGAVVSIAVPVPANGPPWRLRAGAERPPNAFERTGLFLRRILPAGLQFVPDRVLAVRDRYSGWTVAYSEAIESKTNAQPGDSLQNKSSANGR